MRISMFLYKIIATLIFMVICRVSSFTIQCHFNESATISRKSVLLQLENHEYIYIYNASLQIELQSNLVHSTNTQSNLNTHSISKLLFTGNIGKEKYNALYRDIQVNSLKSCRYRNVDANRCSVSFKESTIRGDNIDHDYETAILRLAESCIQSEICQVDLNKIDKDADLYYQSIQSSINELVDFYIPRIISKFVDREGVIDLSENGVNEINDKVVTVSQTGGKISGLNTIQRIKDVSIRRNGTRFTLDGAFRFEELNVAIDIQVSKTFGIPGTATVKTNGLSFNVTMMADLTSESCNASLVSLEIISAKNFNVKFPVIPIKVGYSLQTIQYYLKRGVDSYMSTLNLDCQKYFEFLPNKLKELSAKM